MGGNAFAIPGARLSIAEYEALRVHLLSRLDAFDPIDAAPYLGSKASHGDIDVLVGWDKAAWESGKGHGMGRVNKPSTNETSLRSALAAAGVEDVSLATQREMIAVWSDTVAAQIGGTHWSRSGGQVSVAVPLKVVHEAVELYAPGKSLSAADKLFRAPKDMQFEEFAPSSSSNGAQTTVTAVASKSGRNRLSDNHPFSDLQPNTFVQVDLIFLPPAGVSFQRFAHAYGVTILLLSQLIRRASSCRDFVLQGHRAVLHWVPYPGCPKAEVHLTHEPSALCEYLGLSYEKWGNLTPGTTEDLFAWFADCEEDCRAAKGLSEMAKYGLVGGTYRRQGGSSRLSALDEFGDWLRRQGWVPEKKEAKVEKSQKEIEAEPAKDEKKQDPLSRVHPDSPRPLPSHHAELVRYWGKEAEYTAAVEAIRPFAEQHWAGVEKRKARTERKAAEADANGTLETSDKVGTKELVPGCANICIAS
ncbi:hypothetical protein CcaverHIS002_0210470 [Cutaneotrichosporon cavernicola]|uniref:Uncharacterized protein n=1 Tax=Cutaneotrichosporon cavernicola TaxID=279322 RepID=A0AA48IEE5_9TREE|nr:uncharacterized protein CcaverHIS019_0210480 [Cutaneotrichosporon cavernicola]BEI81887.1 hypothetical protein CcaverHIS002_0210470 [Cutaneotrichosporon cavernicola]BEI89686.1 hypothetical protein CcaverHIS019_0210480 [Cutaneotrichosporon cavernicola]BEI97457.1 hypothetical protein CcaverHIS631_0210460 [Cutaneotrichosporon cavernicola]BEJ05235.1 hypothetical protein CcaverHIS641_0210520 [Cutaneotrichosporon cavernicola]